MPTQDPWKRDALPPKRHDDPSAARLMPWPIIARDAPSRPTDRAMGLQVAVYRLVVAGWLARTLLITTLAVPALALAEEPPRRAEIALAALSAEPAVDPARLGSLILAVAAWVATEMDLPVPATMPRIAFLDPAGMAELRYGERTAGSEPSVAALYDDDVGTIYLKPGWTGATPAELSVLAHEMTHHLQNLSGRPYDCAAAREAEAYALQDRWLGLFGTSLDAEFDLNALSLVLLTRCGPP